MATTNTNSADHLPDKVQTFRFDTRKAGGQPTVHGLVARMMGIHTSKTRVQGDEGHYKIIIDSVRAGIPARSLERLGQAYGIPRVKIVHLAGLSESTYKRRLAKDERLTPEASDRAYRVARIAALAETIFEDHDKATRWMNSWNRVLEDVPINLLDTEAGTEMVETVLHRIDYGIFS